MFVPYLAQRAPPLYGLIKKGTSWDWDKMVEKLFTATKWAVQQIQALQVTDPGKPFELDMHVIAER